MGKAGARWRQRASRALDRDTMQARARFHRYTWRARSCCAPRATARAQWYHGARRAIVRAHGRCGRSMVLMAKARTPLRSCAWRAPVRRARVRWRTWAGVGAIVQGTRSTAPLGKPRGCWHRGAGCAIDGATQRVRLAIIGAIGVMRSFDGIGRGARSLASLGASRAIDGAIQQVARPCVVPRACLYDEWARRALDGAVGQGLQLMERGGMACSRWHQRARRAIVGTAGQHARSLSPRGCGARSDG